MHARVNITRNLDKDADEGQPSACVTWYGMDFDLDADSSSLPQPKLDKYRFDVLRGLDSVSVPKHEPQSLIGEVVWASVIMLNRRPFLCNLRQTMRKNSAGRLPIDQLCREELSVWNDILLVSLSRDSFSNPLRYKESLVIGQDAAASEGAGSILLFLDCAIVGSYKFTPADKVLPNFNKRK